MVVNAVPMKRIKRRVTVDLYDFLTFPSTSSSFGFGGTTPFRANIRSFLTKYALLPPLSSLFPHMMIWQIVFRVDDVTDNFDPSSSVVCLDVVEEDVARSRSVYCDQCRVVGWSEHPVCSKRYHFIIKVDGNSIGGYHKPCVRCGDILHLSELRCKSCNYVTTTDDVEDWVYHQLEDTTHLLHGVIHSNGYGHLLRVNGMEGGSRVLSGCHIMDFWDRLCKTLGVRLIHDSHKSSLRVGDATFKKQRASGVLSWSRVDVVRVEEAMFRVLRAVSGSNWVSSRALRGAVCRVAPPTLLDHCLMELNGKLAVEGMVVKARHNPNSGCLEYRLEPQNVSITTNCNDNCVPNFPPSKEILKQDLKLLYESILHPQTMSTCLPDAIRNLTISSAEKLLDCKQFVKHYNNEKLSSGNEDVICISCELELMDQHKEITPDPPAELVVLPINAIVLDLKIEASKAFQEVYLAFRRFQAEELLGYTGVEDSTQVKLLLGSTGSVRVRGRCLGKNGLSKYRLERGVERWTVDCTCGAKDDDGERMLACDVCGVWLHTRCFGINESDAVPAKFVCTRCKESLQMTLCCTV
ncbi:hypothetical protein V6Z12_A10G179900 [Gossypium hirsutum]|uniref:PHD finger protein At1g33420 isoform X2 n=1 Tax=Gossypium hirsutum TaxID=3635 RepID=A0ABM2YZR2_GOSHI|nr:PHD finger protein At1g33420 isoform X2 [Gossypium hirsutum]